MASVRKKTARRRFDSSATVVRLLVQKLVKPIKVAGSGSAATRELYREAALNGELYFSNEFFHAQKVSVDPNVRARMRELIARAFVRGT